MQDFYFSFVIFLNLLVLDFFLLLCKHLKGSHDWCTDWYTPVSNTWLKAHNFLANRKTSWNQPQFARCYDLYNTYQKCPVEILLEVNKEVKFKSNYLNLFEFTFGLFVILNVFLFNNLILHSEKNWYLFVWSLYTSIYLYIVLKMILVFLVMAN
jgi:hypothetical protein